MTNLELQKGIIKKVATREDHGSALVEIGKENPDFGYVVWELLRSAAVFRLTER